MAGIVTASQPTTVATARVERVAALDGLRGLAALVVLFHHQLLTSVALARPYSGDPMPRGHGLDWWLTYTPLHLLWDGPQAVFVFFVLSGYVLTLPVLRLRDMPWWAGYYPRRVLRLYLPVTGAVAAALMWFEVVRRHKGPGQSTWLTKHTGGHGVSRALHDVVLLRGVDSLDTPLWSLKWEVVFSLLLPVYIFVARRFVKSRVAQAAAMAVVTVLAAGGHLPAAFIYLPMFGFGVLMAFERERLTIIARRLKGIHWWALLVVALLSLNSGWMLYSTGSAAHWVRQGQAVATGVAMIGAAGLVFCFAGWTAARAVGESVTAQWLGKRSFSLYLTHEPLVVSVALLLGGHPATWLVLAICTPAALVLADAFYRLVESRAHDLSQAVGRAVAWRLSASFPAAHRSKVA